LKNKKDFLIISFVILCSVSIFVFRNKLIQIGNLGYIGVFVLCFLSNLTVLLPAPSLMVVVSYSQILSPAAVAAVGALGTTIGETSGYLLGSSINNLSVKWREKVDLLSKHIKNIHILIFIFALMPLPIFDFVGIYAGSNKVKIRYFFLDCYMGKFLKMLFYCVVVGNIFQSFYNSI